MTTKMRVNFSLIGRSCVLASLLLASFAAAHSQSNRATDERLRGALLKAGQDADTLRKDLPSLQCQEDVRSTALHKGKVDWTVSMTADLRVVRGANGQYDERFTPILLDGKPVRGEIDLPEYVEGGFQLALTYVAPERQACYRYTLGGNRLDFVSRTDDIGSGVDCSRAQGVTGFALLDAEGHVTHIERRVDAQLAQDQGVADFAAIDFAPVQLGERMYRLSSRLVSDVPHGKKDAGHFEANYTRCKLFTASITIHGGTEPVKE